MVTSKFLHNAQKVNPTNPILTTFLEEKGILSTGNGGYPLYIMLKF